jgi:hypothetical protein
MRTRLESVVTLPTEERDGRRQPFDRIDLGHPDLFDQPPRVRRDRLEIASLRLRIERAERERRLSRAGHAGKHDERVARNIDVDVLEIVFSRASYAHEAAQALRSFIDGQRVHALRCQQVSHPKPARLRWKLGR